MSRIAMLCLVVCMLPVLAEEEAWEKYASAEYGIEMLLPKGIKLTEKEKAGGWGGLYAKFEGVELYALAKLGAAAGKEEIRTFAERESGISGDHWTKADEGKDANGWKWYEVYVAEKDGILVFGGFGTGPKGNYLLFLKTTKADYEENKTDYHEWFESVKLTQ